MHLSLVMLGLPQGQETLEGLEQRGHEILEETQRLGEIGNGSLETEGLLLEVLAA